MASTTDALADRLVSELNASRHWGLIAHERLRNDRILAWLKQQKDEAPDVRSMGGLVAYWNNPDMFRRQRIISLIAAREQQLRCFPGSFAWWMHQAIGQRRTEMELRVAPAQVMGVAA